MGAEIGVAALDRFSHEVERHVDPLDVLLRVESRLCQGDRESDLRRRARFPGGDAFALDLRQVGDAGGFRGHEALAPAMRADEQLDVEALFQRLQPIQHEAGADIGLVGRERLDERLPAGALVEQLHIDILPRIEALGDSEGQRRVAGRDLRPGEPHLRGRTGDRRREELGAESSAKRRRCAGRTGNFEKVTPRNGRRSKRCHDGPTMQRMGGVLPRSEEEMSRLKGELTRSHSARSGEDAQAAFRSAQSGRLLEPAAGRR